MQKILISACLMGENVRFDGENSNNNSAIIKKWKEEGRLILLCPEVAGGLPVPRPAAEIQSNGSVMTDSGAEVTDAFDRGAEHALALCREHAVYIAILKEGSPSCGSSLINDGHFAHRKISGQGVTTTLLESNGIRVFSENELDQAELYFKTEIIL